MGGKKHTTCRLLSQDAGSDYQDSFPKWGYLLIFACLLVIVPIGAIMFCGDSSPSPCCLPGNSREEGARSAPQDIQHEDGPDSHDDRHARSARERRSRKE